jgi:stage V sporulation protein SpoVS
VRPNKKLAGLISRSLAKREKAEVVVVMAGALIPTESIIYDFSHEEEGVGLIMPVVRVEQVEVVLKPHAR